MGELVKPIPSMDALLSILEKAGPNKLVVLEFCARWSEPCKYMKQAYEKIARDYKESAEFYTVDVDKFKELARDAGVEALPTFLLVKDYDVEDTVVGVKKEELKRSIEKVKPNK